MSTTVDLGKITASVTVGTTTTGAAGTNASVSNSGTTQDAVLNFTIPRGAQGVQGPQGIQGNTGPAGPTGPQGPMGDVAVITPEQQAAFTMYSVPGQNTDGPMTQKAVTDSLVAGSISYDNSQSGLASNNVQGALDELSNSVVNSTDDAQASLDISDQEGYVIARLKGGNIQTLNFDSGKATVLGGANDEDSNLDVADEYGNVIARFEKGHIRTKNFDSSINGSALPVYWKTYLDNKKDELIVAELSIGFAGASFIFITDVHWKDNYKNSPAIISYIRQITQVKDVVCGGDILENHGERAAKIAEMLDWNECVKPVGCINLVGNHDYNTSDQPKSTWDVNRIKPEEFYRMCNSETEKVVSYDYTNNVSVSEAGYRFNAGRYTEYFGFCDNNTQKIRYIFLDSTCVHKPVQDGMTSSDLRISDAQLRWMQDRITELEEGWTVLVFTHIALGANGLFEIGQQIENALNTIYDNASASIAGVICGHCHKTLSYTTSKGYPFISTTCDARKQSQAANDPTGYSNGGDVNEQAFDIFYVNTNNRTIHVIRIGAGDTDLNRDFTY